MINKKVAESSSASQLFAPLSKNHKKARQTVLKSYLTGFFF